MTKLDIIATAKNDVRIFFEPFVDVINAVKKVTTGKYSFTAGRSRNARKVKKPSGK